MGGDLAFLFFSHNYFCISIHTTRVGGDLLMCRLVDQLQKFQSTPPVWVVTDYQYLYAHCYYISIHTTRVGGDIRCSQLVT